jgi:hypothetical protein
MDHEAEPGLAFRVTTGNEPVEGAYLLVTFVMGRKNDVNMLVGPTATDGTAFVASDAIQAHFRTTLRMALMDYRLDTWTRGVEARTMTVGDVRRFNHALEIWGIDAYPADQVEGVQAWGARLAEGLRTLELHAEVVGDEDMTVVVRIPMSIEDDYDKLRWRPEG